jgi:glycine oxidase
MPAQGCGSGSPARQHKEKALSATGATERSEHDVVVVGAGAIGLACAWRLAQDGQRVLVLERERPGAGASSVAAGMLAPVGEATWGEDALLALALRSHALWPGFAAELTELTGEEFGYSDRGSIHVALDRDEAAELRRRFELMEELGLEAEWLRGSEVREREPGIAPAVNSGVSAPHEAALDPGALVGALATACERAGVEIVPGAGADGLLGDDTSVAGVLAGGREHHAGTTVLCAGAWSASDWLPPAVRPPVRPIKGQILTLRGPHSRRVSEGIVVSERMYAVPRGDGRLVVGATVEEMGFDTRVTAGGVHELLREAYRALPDVAELELESAVAGLRPGTPDNAPLIGPGAVDGLVLATGHFRNGILLAPVTAEAIAAVVRGEEPRPELTVADPSRFSGTPLEVSA